MREAGRLCLSLQPKTEKACPVYGKNICAGLESPAVAKLPGALA
ncbi:hypothetical protein [Solidesulfovibrio aerotolerans]|nr:hypothetical protein [Solidesulfovibrio aerotolerans]